MPNGYQVKKAKAIAGTLVLAAAQSDTQMHDLAKMAAMMTMAQWRTASFSAGVPMAELECKVLVVAMLGTMAA